MIMIKKIVFMPIIGKIWDGNLMFIITRRICARIGKSKILLDLIRMDVKMNIVALTVMVGKSSNITQKHIKSILVNNKVNVKRLIAPTITQRLIEDTKLTPILSYFPKTEAEITARSTHIWTCTKMCFWTYFFLITHDHPYPASKRINSHPSIRLFTGAVLRVFQW